MDKFEGIYSNNPYDKNHRVNAYYRENVLIKIQNNIDIVTGELFVMMCAE